MSECQQQKQTQHALSKKTECDYLFGWIKGSLAQKVVNLRDIARNAEEKEVQQTTFNAAFSYSDGSISEAGCHLVGFHVMQVISIVGHLSLSCQDWNPFAEKQTQAVEIDTENYVNLLNLTKYLQLCCYDYLCSMESTLWHELCLFPPQIVIDICFRMCSV